MQPNSKKMDLEMSVQKHFKNPLIYALFCPRSNLFFKVRIKDTNNWMRCLEKTLSKRCSSGKTEYHYDYFVILTHIYFSITEGEFENFYSLATPAPNLPLPPLPNCSSPNFYWYSPISPLTLWRGQIDTLDKLFSSCTTHPGINRGRCACKWLSLKY